MDEIAERYRINVLLFVLELFFLTAVIGGILTPTGIPSMISLMFALYVYLILPGYFILINIHMDDLARVALSPAVSLSIIPTILFNINLFWVRMSRTNVILTITAVIALGVLYKELN